MDFGKLKKALQESWCAETATNGIWNQECPSLNQCAVTALVVQDYFGGELLRCLMTNGDSHYWNRLGTGNEIDLTTDQFDYIQAKPLKNDYSIRQRDYVLSFPDTLTRYNILKQLVIQALASKL